MPQLALHDVTIAYHGPPLLDQVSCRIEAGERIGLLGRNGAGKTTLMRLLTGAEQPDRGSIEVFPGTRIALLTQDVPELPGTVSEIVHEGLIHDGHHRESQWEETARVDRILADTRLDGAARYELLSTGMRRRVLLARALVSDPDVLLLDEPTNHLDIAAIEWLEGFLNSRAQTLMFVTHDRKFLTRLARRILEIDRGKLFDWSCDYATFLERQEAALAAEEKQQALFDKKLAQEEAWIRQGVKARRTRNEGRVRALEAMRRTRAARQNAVGNVQLAIDQGERSGALVLKVANASFGYDGAAIIRGLTTAVMRGDKIGVIGPNGAGKSTLLRGLLGQLPPLSGDVRLGANLLIAYFDQTREQLDPDGTAEDNVGQGKTSVTVGGKTRHIIGYLRDFLFTPEQARTPIRFFSGGQRNRLLLARLFATPANLLVLDEPTNDLDSETLELLEQRLVEYEGTVLLVSHDREFLNNVVTSTLVLNDGEVREYVGGYDDWVRQRDARAATANEKVAAARQAKQRQASAKSESGSPDAGKQSTPKKLSFKVQRELTQLPALIEKLETQQAALHEEMAAETFYKLPGAHIAARQAEERTVAQQLAAAYARWEEIEGGLS